MSDVDNMFVTWAVLKSIDKYLFTSVHNLILVTPVDGPDELIDVAADFIWRCSVGQFLQQLQHVLQTTTNNLTCEESWEM